jgi:hypothetical protein
MNIGTLVVCKKSKVRKPKRRTATFTLSPSNAGPFTVPFGTCSPAVSVPAGTYVITEAPGPFVMTGCSTVPTNMQMACDTAAQTSTVSVLSGATTTATIVNSRTHSMRSRVAK